MSYRPILEVKDLKKHFGVGGGQTLKAVDGFHLKSTKEKHLVSLENQGAVNQQLGERYSPFTQKQMVKFFMMAKMFIKSLRKIVYTTFERCK